MQCRILPHFQKRDQIGPLFDPFLDLLLGLYVPINNAVAFCAMTVRVGFGPWAASGTVIFHIAMDKGPFRSMIYLLRTAIFWGAAPLAAVAVVALEEDQEHLNIGPNLRDPKTNPSNQFIPFMFWIFRKGSSDPGCPLCPFVWRSSLFSRRWAPHYCGWHSDVWLVNVVLLCTQTATITEAVFCPTWPRFFFAP